MSSKAARTRSKFSCSAPDHAAETSSVTPENSPPGPPPPVPAGDVASPSVPLEHAASARLATPMRAADLAAPRLLWGSMDSSLVDEGGASDGQARMRFHPDRRHVGVSDGNRRCPLRAKCFVLSSAFLPGEAVLGACRDGCRYVRSAVI